jgi:hypothetical protein
MFEVRGFTAGYSAIERRSARSTYASILIIGHLRLDIPNACSRIAARKKVAGG